VTLPLIDKNDNFEVIRDQIASIIRLETANQQTLAAAAAKDPALWGLRVFTERANPWEQFRADDEDTSPIVNVWFDNLNFDMAASNVIERQKAEGVFNIDVIGFSVSADDPSGGHTPGDEGAARTAQRGLRLVRNILMSADYTYLGLRGLVWRRMPQAITSFQPQLGDQGALQVVGARLALRVEFNEFSPQYTPETLEFLSIDVRRTEDDEIVLEADYDYTP